ncbi:MAG: TonB-dependent receptor [Ignavibacteria bacterium]|nr:TonB-dependent receptor [Ignavibacteria bacterium]
MKSAIIFILVIAASTFIFGRDTVWVKGRVVDESKHPLAFVTAYIAETKEGTVTNNDGYFRFPTKAREQSILTCSLIGYTKEEISFNPLQSKELLITLREKVLTMKEMVISASSFSNVKEKGVVLNKIDVLMTPGGAADVYQSLKTMPGITQVSESAELYVRGGDALETITIIDGAVMYHPFTFESTTGGLFSNLKTNFVKNLFFSSGGFSAKYGNALSGVLDIETKGIPEREAATVGVSMANSSVSLDLPFLMNAAAFMVDFEKSYTAPIFWLNGGKERFSQEPFSTNCTSSLALNYSRSGKIKFFGMYADDNNGVTVDRAEYTGNFIGNTTNKLFNFNWSDILPGNVIGKINASFNRYTNKWHLGVLNITRTDDNYSIKGDFTKALSNYTCINTGIESENREVHYLGQVPSSDYNLRPDAQFDKLDATFTGNRFGAYIEYEAARLAFAEKIYGTVGLRYDNFSSVKVSWWDPRMSFGIHLSESDNLMFAGGIFHQLPDPRLFSPSDGNPNLHSMYARHIIAAFEHSYNSLNSLRIELYSKKYEHLPLEDKVLNYTNDGYGSANGIDIIAKCALECGLEGWFSYGYISSKRYWMDYSNEVSSNTDITHNISVIAKYPITPTLQLGLSIKLATGQPYTPYLGATYNSNIQAYEPIKGQTNSERLPDYKRFDIRLTHFTNLAGKYPVVLYMEGLNILNIQNIFGYSYTQDYSDRMKVKSYFGQRMIVIGGQITFS